MSRRTKFIIVGALVAAEIAVCAAIIVGLTTIRFAFPSNARFFYFANTRAEETIQHSFAPDGPAALDLTTTHGNIEVTAGDGQQFIVRATKEAWGQNKSDAQAKLKALEVKMTMENGTLHVKVEDPDENTFLVIGSTRSSQVSFDITTPRQTQVKVHTRHGHITLKGSEGQADLTSHYGHITANDVAGDLTADTHHGHVMTRRCGGERAVVSLHSHYGAITTHQVTAKELTIESNNGNLALENVTVDSALTINTHYGRIELDGVRAASLKAKSNNGNITLKDVQLDGKLDLFTHYGALNVATTEASEYKLETNNGAIQLDGGHGRLWLHSHYGAITVRDARRATLDLNTNNGKVTFEGSLSNEADHHIASHYGDISLRLPADTAVYLDADTHYGRIRCEFDVLIRGGSDEEDSSSSGDELYGAINDGSARLRVKTHNGNITIEAQPSE